jgi:hypothetical protein
MAEDDTVMFSSIRPRARPDNVKPSPPFDPTKDDDDTPQEAEKLSIPVTDESGDTIGSVSNNKVSFDQGFFDRYKASDDIAKKTRDSFKQVMDVKDLLNVSDNVGFDNIAGNDVLTVGLGGGFRAFLGGRSIDRPVVGVGLKFAEGGAVDNEMEEILTEKKDPVSGNTAPLGATTAEVRDDIPIMASPNEFMINAATRRYYGTEFFENLQKAAEQGFKRIKQGEESFFRDDELETDQEPQKLQEGGEVEDIPDREIPQPTGGGFGGFGGTGGMFTGFEFKQYVHPSKPEIQIVFFNGRPLSPIPEGYTLKAAAPVEQQEQKREEDDRDRGADLKDQPPSWRNTDVSEWDEDFYDDYAKDLTGDKNAGKPSMVERAILQIVGNLIFPGGGFALEKIANNASAKKAEQVISNTSNFLKTGKDKDGNTLSRAQLDIYNKARVNANFVKMNLQTRKNIFDFSKAEPFASDSPEAKAIIQQQQDYIKTLRDKDDDDDRPPRFGGSPGTFYGGSAEAEGELIDSDLSDEEFFEEFEKGTPSGVGNI